MSISLLVWSLVWTPTRPPMRYEALLGGRPASTAPMTTRTELSQLIRHAVDLHEAAAAIDAEALPAPPTKVWLELSNNESLLISFEHTRLDTRGTCTMRVRQTRVTDECVLDEDSSPCVDVGCVAVRWNLNSRKGIVVDLFQATRGERIGCDLSSADNPKVKWGRLMLRVVDDVASALDIRHMYLADESQVTMRVWDARTNAPLAVPVKLQYLHQLLHGMGYYERSGYYTVEKDEYYGAAGVDSSPCEAARERAECELNAFDVLRTTAFADGDLARAIASLERGEGATPPEESRIHSLAAALGTVQHIEPHQRFEALLDAARVFDASAQTPGQSTPGERGSSAYEFVRRHEAALDARALAAPCLSALTQLLYERSQADHGDELDATGERALRAGALLRDLMFDTFDVWRTARGPPLKRKDYEHEHDTGMRASCCVRLHGGDGDACDDDGDACDDDGLSPIRVGLGDEPMDPIIRDAYFVCDADSDDACKLPWLSPE